MTELPRSFKTVTLWLVLGTAVFLGAKAMQSRQQRALFSAEGGTIEIRRSADGHYHWGGRINGREVDFLIDTGATGTAIPEALARELELPTHRDVTSSTAGGIARGRIVVADVVLQGGVQLQRARLTALPRLDKPLLGMDLLARLRWQQQDGVLRFDAAGAAAR